MKCQQSNCHSLFFAVVYVYSVVDILFVILIEMDQQRKITSFFKMKANAKPTLTTDKRLSLKRNGSMTPPPQFPVKSVKLEEQSNVITIDSSDDDIFIESTPLSIVETSFGEQNNITESQITPNPYKTGNNVSPSTSTRKKYYSPNKKHMITIRNFPVQRNLLNDFTNDRNQENTSAIKAHSKHYEDKSIFFIQMIQNYLQDSSLLSLLNEKTRKMLGNLSCLQNLGPSVVYKLFWRRKGWFRRDKLLEIITDVVDNLNQSINMDYIFESLVELGLLEKGDETNMATLEDFTENLLTLEDVKHLCIFFKLKKLTKKNGIAELKKFAYSTTNLHSSFFGKRENNYNHVLNQMRKQAGACYRLSETARNAIHHLYILMYIGIPYDYIREKKLEHMLDYKRKEIETFPIDANLQLDKPNIIFKDCKEFEEYIAAVEMYEDFLSDKDKPRQCDTVLKAFKLYKELSAAQNQRYESLSSWLRRYTPGYVYVKLMVEGVAVLKTSKKTALFEVAIDILATLMRQDLYCVEDKIKWCDEKALIFHKYLKKSDEAAKELLKGFTMTVPEMYKDRLRSRALHLAKLKNATIVDCLRQLLNDYGNGANLLENNIKSTTVASLPIENKNKGKAKYMIYNKDGTMQEVGVEECARKWYADNTNYDKGGHWEGRIIITIFYLLFWDIIYKPIRNVGIYMNVLQKDPLDLYTQDFYTNRKEDIVNRLYFIRKTNMQNVIHEMKLVWDKRPASEQNGISRDIGWYNCEQVALCLGQHGLLVICKRLATDFKYCQSGFPDLTLFDVGNKRVKFVEVKSDSDSPSIKQLQWMHYLKEKNIDTEFCYVGAKVTSAKSRRRQLSEEPL